MHLLCYTFMLIFSGVVIAAAASEFDNWLLSSTKDGGWNATGNTFRGNIALKMSNGMGDNKKPRALLEKEVLRVLLRNTTRVIEAHQLALMIHALIATNQNPRDYNNLDIVADLLHRLNSGQSDHPYLLLALCNSHSLASGQTKKLLKYLTKESERLNDIEKKALALKAAACAVSFQPCPELETPMTRAANSLASLLQKPVSQNLITHSLIIQALTAYSKESWYEEEALDYVKREAEKDVSVIRVYYAEMALNSRRVPFIKDLYEGTIEPHRPEVNEEISVTITVKVPDLEITIVINISQQESFLKAMLKASQLSRKFKFSYVMDNDAPIIYQVNGTPNHVERNMFWYICRSGEANQTSFTYNRGFSMKLQSCEDSSDTGSLDDCRTSANFLPYDGEGIVLVYAFGDPSLDWEDI